MDNELRKELQSINVELSALRAEVGTRLNVVERQVNRHDPRLRKLERSWARFGGVAAVGAAVGGAAVRFI